MRGWKPAVGLAALAATASLGAAGCGSSPHPSAVASSTTATTARTTTTATTATTAKVPGAAVPTTVPNVESKRNDVEVDSCAAVPGGWAAHGIAFNRGRSPVHFDITINFTNLGQTDEGTGATTVEVPAGRATAWVVTGHFAAVAGTHCVLVGVG
jgi:hypothetical protein